MKRFNFPKGILAKVNFVLLIVFFGILGVVFFAPVKPLEIKGVDIKGTTFEAGGEMDFTINRCKTVASSVSGTATRYFIPLTSNGEIDNSKQPIFISSTDDLGEKGCKKVDRTIDIPAHVKTGCYKLKFVTRYFPSVLREPIKVDYVTKQSFCIEGQAVSAKLDTVLQLLNEVRIESGGEPIVVGQSSRSMSSVAPQADTPQSNAQLNTAQQPSGMQQGTQTTDEQSTLQSIIESVNSLIPLLK